MPGANRWLGFVEGRLGTSLPKTWSDCVVTAHSQSERDSSDVNSPPSKAPFKFAVAKNDNRKRKEILPGLFTTESITCTRDRDQVRFAQPDFGNLSVDVSRIKAQILGDGGGFVYCIVRWIRTGNYNVLVFINLLSTTHGVAISSIASPLDVKYGVAGGDVELPGAIPILNLEIDVAIVKELIILFGRSSSLIFLKTFDVKTAARTSRFSSALW
jgi:hypothetical protein